LGGVRKQELALFTAEEAREYLRSHLHAGLLAQSSGEAALDAVAQEVDHLPLALELVVSYMHETRQSPAEWLEEWRKTPTSTITYHDANCVNYPVSLARVWDQSVCRISPTARDLLNLLAWLAPRPAAFPLGPLRQAEDWPRIRVALGELAKASLVTWPDGAEEISVHRILQVVTRYGQNEEEKTSSLATALATLEASLPDPEWNEVGWRLWEQLAPHCRTLLNGLRDHALEAKATRIMNAFALWLKNRAEHGESEPLYRRALAIDEKSLGPDHPNVARDLHNLAALLGDTNRFAEAEPLFRRVLAIFEKSLGRDHPKEVTSLHKLAAVLESTNRLGEAEPLYRRALAIDEKTFGPDHPNVARGLHNLAGLLYETNRFGDAEPLYRRALAIDEKSFGPNHPNVAIRLNNLALLLRATNRLGEAEPLYRRALAIDEKSFGPDHPNVAADFHNLAALLYATNRFGEAEPLYRRALAILERRLGPSHPNLARGLNNLAELLRVTNRLAEAETLYRQALAINEVSFGPDHPNVARDLNNLAELLRVTNRLAEAETLYRRALRNLSEFGHRTGHEHPHFRTAINNYGGLLAAMGSSEDEIQARLRSAIEGNQ
jgi:tetratricopeptide (TPR) repeat protein